MCRIIFFGLLGVFAIEACIEVIMPNTGILDYLVATYIGLLIAGEFLG